ncbi:hypothetical protein FNF28_02931 [Cafeteria roenbergensis]|uniref:TRPM SLOG domain-containing protein n=1 Tax=Cafeteria roenbergensis TaxID=33653 RepID=A0A5A8DP22_CAFRO|nr:hypothetical protein FNF28_02931 [Cafeteria roenbergensis]
MFPSSAGGVAGDARYYAVFLREDAEQCAWSVLAFMARQWGLRQPEAVFSVTGGANLNKFGAERYREHREAFMEGLGNTASGVPAWVVTGGTQSGVMELAGQALARVSVGVPLIGVASTANVRLPAKLHDAITAAETAGQPQTEPLGCSENIMMYPDAGAAPMVSAGSTGCLSTALGKERAAAVLAARRRGTKAAIRADSSGGISLDPNHTHFILIYDPKRKSGWGGEVIARQQLERVLAFGYWPDEEVAGGDDTSGADGGSSGGAPAEDEDLRDGSFDDDAGLRTAAGLGGGSESPAAAGADSKTEAAMHWASQGTRGAPILPVQFVVGGGPVTLRTVEAAVENRFAVILFRGTGRLCDSLADTACMLPSIEQVVRGRLRALESLVRAKDAQNAPFLQAADSKSPGTIASAATRGLAASAVAAAGRSPEAEHRPIGGTATAARAAIPRPVIGRAGSKARNLAAVPSTPRSLAGLLRSARQPLDEQDITGDAALWVLCADDPARVAMERPVEVCGAGGVTLSAEAEYCAVLPDADRRLMLELLVFGPQLHDLDVGPEDVLEKADEQCGDLRLLGFVASKPGAEQQEAAHRFAIGRALRVVSGSGGAEAWDEARYIKLGSEWLGQVARHVSQRLSQVLGYVFQGRLRHLIPPEPASGVPSAKGAVGQWVTVRRVLAVTLRARKALGGGYVICSLEDLAARGRTLLRRRHLSRATAASLGGARAAEGRASAAGTTAMLQAVGNRVASLETQLEEALALLRAQQGLQSQQSQQQSQQQPSPSPGLGTQGSRRSSDAGLPPGAGRQGLGAVKSRRPSVVPSSQRRAQRDDAPASAMVVTPRRDFSPAGGQLDASAPRHAPPPEHSEALGEGQPISASVSSDSDGGPVDLGINDLMDWLPDTDPAAAYARTVLDAQTLRDAVAVACLALSVRCEEDESAHGLSVPQALRLCVRWGMAERIGEFVRGCDVYLASSQAAKLGPLTASSGRSRPMPGDTRKRKPHLGPRVVPRGEWGDNVNNLSSVVDAVEDFQRALAEAATKSASSPASLWLSGPMAVASPALSLNVSHRDYAGAKGQLGARAAVLSETVNAGLKVAIRNAASLAASLDRADVLAELAACNPGECLSALQVFAAVEISAWAIAAVQCELRHRDALDAAAELLDDTSCLLDNGFAVPRGSPARARGAASAVGDSVRALAGCRFCCDCTESGGPARASEPGKVRAALRRAALVAKTAAHISAPHVHVAGRLSDGVEATVRVREGTREPSFWLGFFLGTVMRSATGKAALREHDRLSKHPDCDSDAVLERKAVNAARLASRPMMGKFLRLRCDKDACNLVESSLPAIWAAVTGRLLVVRFAWRLASSPLRVCLYCAHLLRISSDENSARKASILETATFLEGMAIQLIREAGCTTSPSSWDAGSIELAALWLRSQAEPEWELIDAFLDAHGSKRLGTDAWLLSRRTPLFCEQDPMTILALAAAADCKRFLAEPVVQAVVDELWFCSRWVPDLTAGSDSILSPRPHGKHAAKQSDLLARLGDVDKARTVLKAEQWSQSRPVKSGGKPADGSGARHGDTSKLWAHQLHTPRAKHFAMLVSSLIMLVLHALAALGVRGSSEAVHVEWALACFVAGFAFDDLSLIVRERQLGPLLSDWTTCCFRQSAHGMPRPRCTLRGRRQCSEVAMFHAVLIVSNMLFATTLVLRLVGWGAQIPALGEGAQDLLAFLAVTSGMRVLSLLGAFRTVGVLFIVVREIIKTNLLVWGALAFFILGPMLATFASVFVLRNNSAQDTATSSLFWAIFGMDFALGTNVEASEVPYAPALPQLADALTSVFLLTVLILVNLLVAQMAQTFEAVSSHADMEIRFERVPSTRHFLLSSCLPPPLNLLEVAVKEWCSDAQRVYAKAVHPLEARERGRLKWLRQSALRAVALANSLQDHPGPS